jgi:hypothetical protein
MDKNFSPSGYTITVDSHSIFQIELHSVYSNSVYLQKAESITQTISEILGECSAFNWDDEGAQPISPITASIAEKIANSLPIVSNRPSVFPMASGKIAFQWIAENKTAFLLSVDDRGKITYSAVLKDGEKKNGSKTFSGTLPSDISEPLLRVAV